MPESGASQGFTALLAQLRPRIGDVRASSEVVADVLHAHQSIELAVFPELFLGGYTLRHAKDNAISPSAPELDVIRSAAAATATAVVVGFVEDTGDGIANAAACIDADGTLVGVYRKMQLFGRERDVFTRGESLLIVPLARRPVGVQICFDTEFPEPARALARAGAEVLVTVSANMSPYYADHELATRARALDNRIPHLYANLVGASDNLVFVGGSRAISSDGSIVAQSDSASEEILIARVVEANTAPEVDYVALAPTRVPVAVAEAVEPRSPRR